MPKRVLKNSLLDSRSLRRAVVSLLLAAFPFEQALNAAGPTLPTGGTFTAGAGTVARSANAVTIRQATSRGIIDWSSFSIGAGGRVLFQNGSGATLNRVTGNQMSTILGSLEATGTIYLINPQGVLIGPHGQVKTGGDFVASTLNLPNNLFLSGGSLVFSGNSKAFVKNLGTVSSTGGSIFLIANQTSNSGSLSAPKGSVGLAAGSEVLLKDSNNDQRIFVNAAGGNATNSGTISAAQAELKANGGNVYALAGNNGGQIRATGTATRNGSVWLVSDGGATKVSGSISAQNADGKGGFIETSGNTVDIAKTSIRSGIGGTWLVDPVDLTIDSSAATTIQTALNGGTNVTESTSASSSSGYGTTAAGNGDINVASGISWNSSASLTLSAYRNINVQNGVTIAGSGSGGLALQADNAATGTGTVIFNGTGKVLFTGSGNVDLFYHPAGYPTATNFSSNVTTGSGTFTSYMTVDGATDLQNINSNLAGNYALNKDVDTGSISNFVPIAHGANSGDQSQGFSGIFDGRSHTISNLTISNTADLTTGLFAQTSSSGVIRNVGLVNASVNSTFPGAAVGGMVGESYGTISRSYVTGSVSASGGGNIVVGGLAGENDGAIVDTYSTASVSTITESSCGNCIWIGGLVGDNGLINYNTASIANSLATGTISVTGPASASVGGLVGENDAIITSSYFDTQSTGQAAGDGFCNLCISDQITSRTTAQLQSGSLPTGFNSSIWSASAGQYPKLGWQLPPGVSVTGIVYNGTTPLGSVAVVGLANGTSFGSTTTNASGAFTLLAPAGTTGILAYLTGGSKGNTFSNNASPSFSGVDIYTNSLRLINVTTNNYTGMLNALSSALGSNTGSNFLFSMSGGNLTLGAGTNFVLVSSVDTNIDQSIAGTGTALLQSSGNLTLSPSITITASGTGTPLTLVSGGIFTNSAGANALTANGGGRWLVYSQNPVNDTLGSLSYGFKQYNATYGSTTVAQATGNGLLYTRAPILTPGLTGSTSKTYDGGTTATLTPSNLTSTGALAGDTATLGSTGATYADKNAGSSKSVTATGLSATATDSTGASVYGYQLSSTSASGNIGTINAAQLTYAANAAGRVYGSANPAFSGTVTGFVGGDTQASATTGTLAFTSPATTANNVGSYAINGSGLTANNGNYTSQQAAGNASALTINPAVLAYTANTAARTYGSANPAFSGTVTGFVNSDTQASATSGTLSFASTATTSSNAGSYAIDGSGLTANSNYTLQQAAGNATAFTINPALLTYTANAASRTYGSSNPVFSGTVTGFVNSETQASATSGTLAFTSPATAASNTGSYAINGTGLTANNGNYTFQQAAGNASALTIDPATLTYTANAASRTYGSANPAFSGAVTGFVNSDTQASATTGAISFTSTATAASNTGAYAINGSGLAANNGNYTFQQAAGNAAALTIDPAVLTYTANAASRTYGDANPIFSGTLTGFVNGETLASATSGALAFTSSATTASNVGSYAVNGSGLAANNGNYTFQQATGNATALTINPALLTYTADAASRIFGAVNPSLSGTITGFVNSDTQGSATSGALAFTSAATTASNVGSYAISGSGLTANNGNYTFQQAAGNATALTIDPAVLTYTANAASRTYGSANPAFSGTVTGFVNSDTQASATTGTLSFTSTANAANNVGSYAVNGSGLTANNGNYTFQQAAGNPSALIIDPATLTYTANAASRTYGDANPAFSGTLTGFVNGETQASATSGTLAFTSPTTTASNVGSYGVNGSGLAANNGNYTFQQAAGNSTALTIDPAVLTYTADAASRTYGAVNPSLSGTITGFVNSDTQGSATSGALAFTSAATTASNVGSYAISGSGLTANNGNYTFQQAAGNATALTIDPAVLAYAADAVSRGYGAANPTLTGTVTGFVNGDTQASATTGSLSFSTSATSASNAGSYAIDGSGLTANGGNYTLQQASGNATALTINPALLTYVANAATRTYGDANPAFSGTLAGFVNGETQTSATTGTLAFTSPAAAGSNVGSYAINGSGLTANNGNYTFQQAAGNTVALTIDPAMLTYTANSANRTYGGANPVFSGAVTGFVNSDTQGSATSGTLAFTSPATTASSVGAYAINGSGLTANNGNYAFQQAANNAAALTIDPAVLTYVAEAASRTYGASNPAFTGSVTGFVNGDNLGAATSGSAAFTSAATGASHVGTYAVNGSGLTVTDGNYTLQQASGNASALTITPAQVTASILANNKVYDATTNGTGRIGALSGVLNGDNVSVDTTGAAYAFDDKNVGIGKTVSGTGATLAGATASDYVLSLNPGAADITPAPVFATLSANDKVYDATAGATGRMGALSGVLGSDSVALNSSAAVYSFSDKNVGAWKSVSAAGAFLAGADGANYTLMVPNATASITPASLTATFSANSKIYDGSTVATGSIGSLRGVLGNDAVTLNAAGAVYLFETAGAGIGKTVTGTGTALSGADAANYRLTVQNGLANINPVSVTVSILGATRPTGAANPGFAAAYSGQPIPGVDIPALLSNISFQSSATPGSAPGTYLITGRSSYPNVDLTIVPGTLNVTFTNTPQADPSLVTAKRTTPPPLTASALAPVLAPNSLGIFQVNYSTDWSALDSSGSRTAPLASSSFLNNDSSETNYPGGIRPW